MTPVTLELHFKDGKVRSMPMDANLLNIPFGMHMYIRKFENNIPTQINGEFSNPIPGYKDYKTKFINTGDWDATEKGITAYFKEV